MWTSAPLSTRALTETEFCKVFNPRELEPYKPWPKNEKEEVPEESRNREAAFFSSGEASNKGDPVASKPRRTPLGVSNNIGTSRKDDDRFKTSWNETKAEESPS